MDAMEVENTDRAQRQEHLKTGANLSVAKVIDQIYDLDRVIELWNDELKRAQPLLPGRLIFRFRVKYVSIESERYKDYVPAPGKMIKKVSGAWWFVFLDKKDTYKKLSDLRVGKSFPSDRVVVRLIDGIESMINQRNKLSQILSVLRSEVQRSSISAEAELNKRLDDLPKLKSRIKLDWHNDADSAFKAIRARDAVKNEARAKKMAGA